MYLRPWYLLLKGEGYQIEAVTSPGGVLEALSSREFVQKPWDNSRLLSILRTQIRDGITFRKKRRLEVENKSFAARILDVRDLLNSSSNQATGCCCLPTELPKSEIHQVKEFGEERVSDLLARNRTLGASQLQEVIMETVTEFSHGNFLDDATVIVLAVN